MKKVVFSLLMFVFAFVKAQDTTHVAYEKCPGSEIFTNYLETDTGFVFLSDTIATVSGTYCIVSGSYSNIICYELTILPPADTGNYYITKCIGDSVYVNGGFTKTTGVYYEPTINEKGCDSITRYHVNFINQGIYDTTMYVCQGKYVILRSKKYSVAGDYTIRVSNGTRCDSLVILHLIVNPTYSSTSYTTITQGQSYNFYGTDLYNMGIYTKTFQTVNGCDSIIKVNLTVVEEEPEQVQVYDEQGMIANGTYAEVFSKLPKNKILFIKGKKFKRVFIK